MADDGPLVTVTVDKTGPRLTVEVMFGFANVGVYRLFMWDTANTPTPIGVGNNVEAEPVPHEIPVDANQLTTIQLSYETQMQSPQDGANQMYSLFVLVRQSGAIVQSGSIERSGQLTAGAAKTVIGFVRFQ